MANNVGDSDSNESDHLRRYQLLFGGDQVTTVRARSSIRLRETHAPNEQLDGFLPVVTDWHARMTLVAVSDNSCVHVWVCMCIYMYSRT